MDVIRISKAGMCVPPFLLPFHFTCFLSASIQQKTDERFRLLKLRVMGMDRLLCRLHGFYLPKASPIHIIKRAVPAVIQFNDIADGHGITGKARRLLVLELQVKRFQVIGICGSIIYRLII